MLKLALKPSKETLDLKRVEQGSPVYMLNLLKFKEKAKYENPQDNAKYNNKTGKDAYETYVVKVKQVAENLGGRVVYVGDIKGMFIGDSGEKFDMAMIVMYPTIKAFIGFTKSAALAEISMHREAGLEGQLLIPMQMNHNLKNKL